jgi:hypothetical protein
MACIICYEPCELQSGCGCRGDAGLAHVACRVRSAEIAVGMRGNRAWFECQVCGQAFTGEMRKGLSVAWVGAESRSCTERCDAEMNRAITLVDEGKLGAAVKIGWRVHLALTCEETAPTPNYGEMVDRFVVDVQCVASNAEKVLANVCNVAKVFQLMDFAHAGRLISAAVDRSRALFGVEHHVTLLACSIMAGCFVKQGNFRRAEMLQRDLVQVQTRVLGEQHPLTMQTTGDLAECLARWRKFDESERVRCSLLANQERVLGRNHPATRTTKTKLAMCLSETGRHAEADAMMREVLDAPRHTIDGNAETLMVSAALALNLGRMHRIDEAERVVRTALGAYRVGECNAHAFHLAHMVLASLERQRAAATKT